jgi:monoamine oxidase
MKTTLLSTLRRAFVLAQATSNRRGISTDALQELAARRAADRRQFLKTTARTGAVLSLGGPSAALDLLNVYSRTPANIAIVGAGMAGLSAAYFLRRKNIQATVFEGDKRPGGRIKSVRKFGNGNLNTEIGAEFIDTSHADMLWLVRMLGLEAKLMDVETDTFGERDAFFFENRHYSLREVLAEFQSAYPRIRADQKKAEGRQAAAFDRLSMADYIENLPVSNWVKQLLHAAYLGENGMETGQQSAANLLDIFTIERDKFYPFGMSDERFKVSGGNEQIPQGLAGMLESQIRYEHKLLALKENKNRSLTLTFSQGGSTQTETFDAVIMTLPFTVLRELDVDMELPPLKRRVINELGYGANTKFILETTERSWRQAGYRGFLFNEQISNGWDSAQMQQGNRGTGAYTCFFGGERARNAARGTEKEQLAYVLPALDGAFPGSKASLTGNMELAHWPGNPFIKASYSCFKAGQVSDFEGAAFEPVRHLYFAGEHCSTQFWGFMNGAAETGRKAAEKILKKMRVR